MNQNHHKESNGKKKRKWFRKKPKKKDIPTTQNNTHIHSPPIQSDDSDWDKIPTMPHKQDNNNNNPEEHKQDNNTYDEIDNLVDKMIDILSKLKQCCHTHNNTRQHTMDIDRFQKLVDWVDFSESNLSLLLKAWNHESFWPFLSTTEATEQVSANQKQTMLIRLSNTKPGAITVTRVAKVVKNNRMDSIVKHKRYFPSETATGFGKLCLTGAWGEREVTWDGLLAHLKQKECCICLEDLTTINNNKVSRLNCGHHFHRHCIFKHVEHSKQQNGTDYATCPLCRKKIENVELIYEPSLAVYKPIPDMSKSKSFDALPNHNKNKLKVNDDQIPRANTAEFTPQQQQQQQQVNHNWGQFGNHLGVNHQNSIGFSDEEDDYGNVAQVRNQYNKNKMSNK